MRVVVGRGKVPAPFEYRLRLALGSALAGTRLTYTAAAVTVGGVGFEVIELTALLERALA